MYESHFIQFDSCVAIFCIRCLFDNREIYILVWCKLLCRQVKGYFILFQKIQNLAHDIDRVYPENISCFICLIFF